MLKLNLASNKLKKEIKLRHIYKFLVTANYVLVLIIIFIAIIVLTAKIILQNNFNKITEETTLISKSGEVKNLRIKEINNEVKQIDVIQNEFYAWSYILKEIDEYADDNIRFNSIKINAEKMQIELYGNAAIRQSLLDLKNGFESSDVFINLDFPMKNILEKENIDFVIKADLNSDNIH